MLLAVQIYAPLDDSPNHRTLYVFCCLDGKCHYQTGGWVCYRDEAKDTSPTSNAKPAATVASNNPTSWVDDADDWDDDDAGNSPNEVTCEPEIPIGSLMITSNQSTGEIPLQGTAESSEPTSTMPSAEVEGMEESVTLDDAPPVPTTNIRALLGPSSVSLPELFTAAFSSFYLSVVEEPPASAQSSKLDSRVRELMDEYQKREKCDWKKIESSAAKSSSSEETYEKCHPSHGDQLVHKFITRVQQSGPEQLIRYQRSASPLLLRPINDRLPSCRYCSANLVFEMQLMPHLSRRLTLTDFPDNPNPVEIGTVIIFTCSQSCWETDSGLAAPRQENLIVQAELFW